MAPTPSGTPTAAMTTTGTPTPVPTETPIVGPTPLSAAKTVERCQQWIEKAGERFVTFKLRQLGRCTQAVARCIQTVEDGARQDACVARAQAKCLRVLEDKLVRAQAKLDEMVRERCGGLEFGSGLLDARLGLGYERATATCAAEYGVPNLGKLADVNACVGAAHACRAEQLFELVEPRAQELLGRAGIAAGMRATLGCLVERPGGGAGVAEKGTLGRPLARCSAALKRAAERFTSRKRQALGRCVGAAFVCEQSKRDEADCRAWAVTKCTRALARSASEEQRLTTVLARACRGVPYAALLDARGLDLAALETECARYGVENIGDDLEQYAACVMQQHECRAEELLAIAMPRAAELFGVLDTAGLDPALQFPSAVCPAAAPAP